MEQTTRKRTGVLFFWLVFLAMAGAIVATVLLANDRRNLKLVMRELGIEEQRRMVIPKPGVIEAFKGKRIAGVAIAIPGQMFLPPVIDSDGAFLRSLAAKNAEGLCRALRKEGFDMSEWAGSAFAPTVFECSYEATLPNASKPDDPSTLFMMVKGTSEGDLLSARAKIVVTERTAQADFAKRAADALKVFALETAWLDLADDLPKVAALQAFTTTSHGITVRLQGEFSGPGRFNLILSAASPLTPSERRTQIYFDRKRHWPLLPEHGGPKVVAKVPPVEG
jgi:hypothetical protein